MKTINASMSRRGGSRIGKFEECPTRFYKDRYGPVHARAENGGAGASKGSIGHVMMAHHLLHAATEAGEAPEVNGEVVKDSSDYRLPVDAGIDYADTHGLKTFVPVITEAYKSWVMSRIGYRNIATHIESETFGVFGWRRDQWGLWAVPASVVDELSPSAENPTPPKVLPHITRGDIEIDPLNAPGHEEHGWPVWISRRRDAVWRTPNGSIETVDHKFLYDSYPKNVWTSYGSDKYLKVMWALDSQEFGRKYNNLWLLAIQNRPPHKVNYIGMKPSRRALQAAFHHIFDLEHQQARLYAEDPSGETWPMGCGLICANKYRVCGYFRACHGEPLS